MRKKPIVITSAIILVLIFLAVQFLPISLDFRQYNRGYKLLDIYPDIRFNKPVDLQHAGDGSGRIFIVEQGGKIWMVDNGKKSLFLDISFRVISGGELGLLGLTFHPDFESNGYFFVDYTANNPLRTVIARYSVDENGIGDPSTEVIILEVEQPYSNHNAGTIFFGPNGLFFITLGDGGSAGDPENNGQSLNTLLGSILRIDVDNNTTELNYAIPADNPFITTPNARPEIFAYGLRNPWKVSYDSISGLIIAADVGQNKYEEVDIIESGKNYGWNIMEGFHCYNAISCDDSEFEAPIVEYDHSQGK